MLGLQKDHIRSPRLNLTTAGNMTLRALTARREGRSTPTAAWASSCCRASGALVGATGEALICAASTHQEVMPRQTRSLSASSTTNTTKWCRDRHVAFLHHRQRTSRSNDTFRFFNQSTGGKGAPAPGWEHWRR